MLPRGHAPPSATPPAVAARPVAAIVLAAGKARRFGAQKLLAPYGGSTVVRTVVDTVRAAGVEYLVVVGGPGGEAVRAAVGGHPVVWVENPEPDRGLSSSVATGMAAMPPNVGAALMVLGDQPTVSVRVVTQVVTAWRAGPADRVAPATAGCANPVLFDSAMFTALGALEG